MKKHLAGLAFALAFSVSAVAADVTVTTPTAGAAVNSPFVLNATSVTCGTAATTSMGYALDSGAVTTVLGQSLAGLSVPAALGPHTLHVSCAGVGTSNTTAVNISVQASVYSIQTLSNWTQQHDGATGSTSSGTSTLLADGSRRFDMTYSAYGGELYHVTWANDTTVHAFIYTIDVALDTPSTVANVELDMNQVTADGNTIIFGFQCDGWSGTWDYTTNAGTPTAPDDRWIHSVPCLKPSQWGAGVTHHIVVGYRRDDSGNVSYVFVAFDGVLQQIGVTVPSAFSLGWTKGVLLTNFQLDGLSAGTDVTATARIKNLSITRY